MEHTPLFWKVVFLGIAAGAIWLGSLYVARYTYCSDFPVFYAAARSIIDENGATHSLYDPDLIMKYRIPEPVSGGRFIYSKSVAYLLLPLGFLPYYPAKATMIFANILAYIWGLGLVLKNSGSPWPMVCLSPWSCRFLYTFSAIDSLCSDQRPGFVPDSGFRMARYKT